MGLVLVWANLDPLVLPFLVALTTAACLALPLRTAAERSGLPTARERCIGCRAEAVLLASGRCPERCTVNELGAVGRATFVATAAVAVFAGLAPSSLAGFAFPLGDGSGPAAAVLLALVIGGNAAAAALIAVFFLQDLPEHRTALLTVGASAALAAMTVGRAVAGPVARVAALVLPITLVVLVLGLGAEWRARHDRPAFGLRSLGLATAPLFGLAVLAAIRVGQILALAHG